MAFQEPRRETENLLLMCEEPQYRACQEFTPRSLTPSTMTTTTIVDASVSTSIVGCYVIPENGSARGQVRQVKSVSGTTATVDAAWTSTASVTTIRVFTPADVPVRVTTGSGTTTITSSVHGSITNEPDDYWQAKGYHLIGAGGTNAGKATDVTDFATSGGVFSHGDTLSSNTAGDLFLLRKMLRPEGQPTVDVTQNFLERALVSFSDADVQVPTSKAGSASFELPVRGLTASAGSATQAVRPVEASDLLAAIFTETRDTGALIHATAPGTAPDIVVASGGSGYTVGGFVLASTGEVGQVRSISSNTLTLGTSHVTTGSVAAGSALYASCHYKRKNSDFRTFTVDFFRGGLYRQVLHGCLPSLTLSISRDNVARMAWNYSAGDAFEYTLTRWVTKGATLPIDILDTSVPNDAKGSRCLLNGTNVLMSDLSIDFGFAPSGRQSLNGSNQLDGHTMALAPVSMTFSILADEDDRSSFEDIVDLMMRRATVDFLYQKGSAPTETFAVCVPALQLAPAKQSFRDGQGVYEVTGKAILPQAVPSNSFNAALPAISIGWL